MPGWPSRDSDVLAERTIERVVFVDDQFSWPQALNFALQGFEVRRFGQAEASSRQVEPRNAKNLPVCKYGGHDIIAIGG